MNIKNVYRIYNNPCSKYLSFFFAEASVIAIVYFNGHCTALENSCINNLTVLKKCPKMSVISAFYSVCDTFQKANIYITYHCLKKTKTLAIH